MRTGVLLVNLGTPQSSKPKDVYRYLIEFLTDGRVIDVSWFYRQLLVRGIIVPFRYRTSAKAYEKVWTEEGSPLFVYGKKLEEGVGRCLGESFSVKLAMRYQQPSMEQGLEELRAEGVDRIVLFPLFPQYASATTGSVMQRAFQIVQKWPVIPQLLTIPSFPVHPSWIDCWTKRFSSYPLEDYDKVVFSFHGLPHKHLRKADRKNHCLATNDCCQKWGENNRDCYAAQCVATAQAIAKSLHLPPEKMRITFQSRLGKEPWLEPDTESTLCALAKEGGKNVLVCCPSFVCDCLETVVEIGMEAEEAFRNAGGESLTLVPGLNDQPDWMEAASAIVRETMAGKNTSSLAKF